MADEQKPEPNAAEATFLSHLIELRNRLFYALVGVFVVSLPLLYYSNDVYVLIAKPLMAHLPSGAGMIATDIASPFMTPIKLAFIVALAIAAPWVLYQIWAFIAPGLYRHERRLVVPLLVSSTLLFYAGMAFAYFVVFPAVFYFFVSTAPPGVAVMTDIKSYLDFVFGMFIAFGIAFEVPVAVVLLARIGVLNPASLAQKRPYVFLGIFVVAAILTPPDVFSQTFLALPMYVLFEVGLFFAHRVYRERDPAETGSDRDATA
jgi:sec-independent protein translocase protein TatC